MLLWLTTLPGITEKGATGEDGAGEVEIELPEGLANGAIAEERHYRYRREQKTPFGKCGNDRERYVNNKVSI